MTRPIGEVREALSCALDAFTAERGLAIYSRGVTHTELAQRAQVAMALAKSTVRNMARDGALVVLGVTPEPGVNRGMVRYAPPSPPAADAMQQLEELLRIWSRPR